MFCVSSSLYAVVHLCELTSSELACHVLTTSELACRVLASSELACLELAGGCSRPLSWLAMLASSELADAITCLRPLSWLAMLVLTSSELTCRVLTTSELADAIIS